MVDIAALAEGMGVYMEQSVIDTIRRLRSELHRLAEPSGEEKKTKAHLMEFFRHHTSFRLEDEGQWFCAVHQKPEAAETIAFRVEMDALPFGERAAHDGSEVSFAFDNIFPATVNDGAALA